MNKVTAFVGSARKKHTYHAVRQFLDNLQALGDVETEIVMMSDHQVGTCRGCIVCFEKGEELCPLKDDRDLLIGKITASDGVVFASPNYSFQVSGIMKIFLDRIGFFLHRPRFFGKTFTGIVAQGIYGGEKIVKYFDFVANGLGFNTVKGACVLTREPISEKQKKKNDQALAKLSRRFHARLMKPAYPAPSLFKLFIFRMARTGMGQSLDESAIDYRYYREKGWFESDYYYPTRLSPLKKFAGSIFDWLARRIFKK